MTLLVRITLIVLFVLIALSILSAGHAWEAAHPRSTPTHGRAYVLTILAMILITLAALKRRGGGQR
jgi:hypothetical protein